MRKGIACLETQAPDGKLKEDNANLSGPPPLGGAGPRHLATLPKAWQPSSITFLDPFALAHQGFDRGGGSNAVDIEFA